MEAESKLEEHEKRISEMESQVEEQTAMGTGGGGGGQQNKRVQFLKFLERSVKEKKSIIKAIEL